MSPEALSAVGAGASRSPTPTQTQTPAPSPSPAAAAAPGTSGSGGTAAGDAGSGGAAGSDSSAGNTGGGAKHTGQSAGGKSKSGQAGDGGQTRKSAANSAHSHDTRAAKLAHVSARSGKNFSQTLAQSLASPAHAAAHAAAQPPAVDTPKPAKTSATHGADKGHKTDPVSAAMAMMSQVAPASSPTVAAASSVAQAHAAKLPAVTHPVHIDPSSVAAGKDAQALAQTRVLAQATADSASAPQGAPGQAAHTTANGANTLGSAAALSAGQLAGAHAAPSPAAASATLSASVGSSGWTEQLGTQLTWMARQGVQSASLQVSPQHLGPVQVKISVHHGQASVWFGAAQPETRQALTQALPELRAMFANQGLNLTDSGVSRDSPRESRPRARAATIGEVGTPEGVTSGTGTALAGTGLIGTYA